MLIYKEYIWEYKLIEEGTHTLSCVKKKVIRNRSNERIHTTLVSEINFKKCEDTEDG